MNRAALLLLWLPLTAQADYLSHPRAPQLLERMRSEYGFSETELAQVSAALGKAQRLPQLVEAEQKAPEKTQTWTQYAKRLDNKRIEGGALVLREYPDLLARAEAEFGVPAPVIAAILGVETLYGRITGKTRVLDALATQGFDHPTRSPFFFSELAEYFAFCRDFGFDPAQPAGSYAGAMGAAQFMPSNYRRLALDYNGDGKKDLWNLDDAIGSIGYYFRRYKPELAWRRGEPLVVRAQLDGPIPAALERNAKAPTRFAWELDQLGIHGGLPPQTPVGLIELALDGGGFEYWLALPNFYSVMTYNPRVFYAMAVAQLAMRIEERSTAP